eukprot:COSAG05_NODE_13420_length_431_cov_0.548193_1_plen_23_part_10
MGGAAYCSMEEPLETSDGSGLVE